MIIKDVRGFTFETVDPYTQVIVDAAGNLSIPGSAYLAGTIYSNWGLNAASASITTLNISDVCQTRILNGSTSDEYPGTMEYINMGGTPEVPLQTIFAVRTTIMGIVQAAGVMTVHILSGGKDYTTADLLTWVDPNGDSFLCTVDPVNEAAGSAVSGVTVTACGNNYQTMASAFASGGTGSNCILKPLTFVVGINSASTFALDGQGRCITQDDAIVFQSDGYVTTPIVECGDGWNCWLVVDGYSPQFWIGMSAQMGTFVNWFATMQITKVGVTPA